MHVPHTRAFRCLHTGILVALAAACGGPSDIDGEVTTLVVQGVVADRAGAPVSGAIVVVAWMPGACADEILPFPPDTTGGTGAYEIAAWSWGTCTEACVRVTAEPPAGGGLLGATVEIGEVPLDPTNGPDTLAVGLTLNPS